MANFLLQHSLDANAVPSKATDRQCVGERTKSTREKKGQNKSPCRRGETRAVSHEKTRQGSTLCHAKTSLEGIQKQSHVAKPRGQKIQKIREDMFKWPKICEEQG